MHLADRRWNPPLPPRRSCIHSALLGYCSVLCLAATLAGACPLRPAIFALGMPSGRFCTQGAHICNCVRVAAGKVPGRRCEAAAAAVEDSGGRRSLHFLGGENRGFFWRCISQVSPGGLSETKEGHLSARAKGATSGGSVWPWWLGTKTVPHD